MVAQSLVEAMGGIEAGIGPELHAPGTRGLGVVFDQTDQAASETTMAVGLGHI